MMRSTRWTATAMAAVLVTTSLSFSAEVVTRKSDGKKFGGTITDMSKNEFKVKKAVGEPDTIQANDVAAIEWDSGGGDLRLGYGDENNGRYDAAIEKFTKAKEAAKSPSPALKGEFDYLIARASGKQALGDPSKQAAAIKLLQAAQKSHDNHFRFYESVNLLGQVQIAAADYAGARTTYTTLGKAPWNEAKLASKIALGRILVAEKKFDEAIKEFESAAAAATDAPLDQVRKYEALLGQARTLASQNKHEDALKLLDEVTDKGPSDEAALQAEAYVIQGNALQVLNRPKEAALAYLHVDLLYSKESSAHAEALFNLSKVWTALQNPERSTASVAKLAQIYPNSSWTKQLGAVAAPAEGSEAPTEKASEEKKEDAKKSE